ncbi:MAG: RsmD family RNA methyltransferase [Chitinophagales bacterium]|nr:RsmD family RNA methyltransferase [Chitinophagales bacterium]
MRIIGGAFKGRRFNPPIKNWPTRPTTDFAKEGLFNILNNRMDFESISVLDLFGGTGSMSYEFISRGCKNVTYVDQHKGCISFVKEVAQTLAIEPYISIYSSDAFKFLSGNNRTFDFIFADPPYALPKIKILPDIILGSSALDPHGTLVIEHDSKHSFKDHPLFKEERKYGDSTFTFFEAISR